MGEEIDLIDDPCINVPYMTGLILGIDDSYEAVTKRHYINEIFWNPTSFN